jgi:hypothetical protein
VWLVVMVGKLESRSVWLLLLSRGGAVGDFRRCGFLAGLNLDRWCYQLLPYIQTTAGPLREQRDCNSLLACCLLDNCDGGLHIDSRCNSHHQRTDRAVVY